jgi:hypothetical protein
MASRPWQEDTLIHSDAELSQYQLRQSPIMSLVGKVMDETDRTEAFYAAGATPAIVSGTSRLTAEK